MTNSVLMIDLERFAAGDLPMVCVRTGVRAAHLVSVKSRREERHEGSAILFRGAAAVGLRAVTDAVRPTGLLPFAAGQEGTVTAYYVRKTGVELHGVHPEFVAAYNAMIANEAEWTLHQIPLARGPIEQVSLGTDPERAGALVAELQAEGFHLTYEPSDGTQRVQVRESQLRHLSRRLAQLAPGLL